MQRNSELNQLYNQVYQNLQNGSFAERMAFIQQNAYLYKESITDLLYIHGQNKEVYNLKTLDEWSKYGYQVMNGQKAIQTVIDLKNIYSKRKSLFDITQVAGQQPLPVQADFPLNAHGFNYLATKLNPDSENSLSANDKLMNYLNHYTDERFRIDAQKKGVKILSDSDKQLIPLIALYTIHVQMNQDISDFSFDEKFKNIYSAGNINFFHDIRIANNLAVKAIAFFKDNYLEAAEAYANDMVVKEQLAQENNAQLEKVNNLLNQAGFGKTGIFTYEITEANKIDYYWTGSQIELFNLNQDTDLRNAINEYLDQPIENLLNQALYNTEQQDYSENESPVFSFESEIIISDTEVSQALDELIEMFKSNPDLKQSGEVNNLKDFQMALETILENSLVENYNHNSALFGKLLEKDFYKTKTEKMAVEIFNYFQNENTRKVKNDLLNLPLYELDNDESRELTIEGALSGIGYDIYTKDEMIQELEKLRAQYNQEHIIADFRKQLYDVSQISESELFLFDGADIISHGTVQFIAQYLEKVSAFEEFEGRFFDFSGVTANFGIDQEATNQATVTAQNAEKDLIDYLAQKKSETNTYQPFSDDRFLKYPDGFLTVSAWTPTTEKEFEKYGYQVGYDYTEDGSWEIIVYESTKVQAIRILNEIEQLIKNQPSIEDAKQALNDYKDDLNQILIEKDLSDEFKVSESIAEHTTIESNFPNNYGLNTALYQELLELHEPDNDWTTREKAIISELIETMDKEIARKNITEFAEKNNSFFERIFITKAIKNEVDQPLEERLERHQAFYTLQTEVYQKYRAAYINGIDPEESLAQWKIHSISKTLQNFEYGCKVIDDGKNVEFYVGDNFKVVSSASVGDNNQTVLEELYQQFDFNNFETQKISQSNMEVQNAEKVIEEKHETIQTLSEKLKHGDYVVNQYKLKDSESIHTEILKVKVLASEEVTNVFSFDVIEGINNNNYHVTQPTAWYSPNAVDSDFQFANNEQIEIFNQTMRQHQAEIQKNTENQLELPSENTNQDDMKTDLLLYGTGVQNGKYRINAVFSETAAQKTATINFLKDEYGTGGRTTKYGLEIHDAKGIELDFRNGEKFLMKWSEVYERLKNLVNSNQYLSEAEQTSYEKWLYHEDNGVFDNLPKLIEKYGVKQVEANQLDLFSEEMLTEPIETSKVETVQVKSSQSFSFPTDTSNFYPRSQTDKVKANIEAIQLSKSIHNENRLATAEEQTILSKYVGWGGLANDFFDESNSRYATERLELKNLVTDEEYLEMRRSSLTAYYTDPLVIQSIYQKLNEAGFSGGRILDPATGTGNFLSAMPKSIYQNSDIYGVEIDTNTANIAKLLHSNADIQVTGYEKTNFNDNSLDLVVANVPFSDSLKINDSKIKKSLAIHDYFILNTIDQLRSGGISAVITSSYTLDKKDSQVRRMIAEKADLIGAVRLPNTAFKKIAGTEVTTDILFFQKLEKSRSEDEIKNLDWINAFGLSEDMNVLMNQYFHEHSKQILGQVEISGMFGGTLKVTDKQEQYNQDSLTAALSQFELQYHKTDHKLEVITNQNIDGLIDDVQPFTFFENNNEIYYNGVDGAEFVKTSPKAKARFKGLITIRNSMLKLLDIQSEINFDINAYEADRLNLNQKYDQFFDKYGAIHDKTNWKLFRTDNFAQAIGAIELVEELPNDEQAYHKSEFFDRPTVRPIDSHFTAENATDALNLSVNQKQKVDLEFMSEIYQKSQETIIEELADKIFLDPKTTKYVTAEDYLSGDVMTKLSEAESVAETDPIFEKNVSELRRVQPEWLSLKDIDFKVGTRWIPKDIYEQFLAETLDIKRHFDYESMALRETPNGRYDIKGKIYGRNHISCYQDFGTKRKNALELFEDSLNYKTTVVRDTKRDQEGKPYKVVNPKETMSARDKQTRLVSQFEKWVVQDYERVQRLETLYNEQFNRMVYREYNGDSLQFPGLNKNIELRSHQKNAIARGIQTNRALYAHVVGSGKTLTMIGLSAKLKELGLINKPMFAVPNAIVNDFGQEIIRAYPQMKVLVATEKDFEKSSRRNFLARIATGDYDAIVMAQSQFSLIPLSLERQEKMILQKIEDSVDAMAEIQSAEGDQWTIKQQEKHIERLKTKLGNLKEKSKKDNFINFESLGIDFLFVDEAHNYKNLFLDSVISSGVAGVSQSSSGRADDMFDKVRYIQELNEAKGRGGGVVFATGTPISNSMVELYTMMNFLEPDILKLYDVDNFNKWGSAFANIKTDYELNPEGTNFKLRKRFASFTNLPELMTAFKQVADIQTADMLNLPTPNLKEGKVITIESKASDAQKEYVQSLAERAEIIRAGEVEPWEDNMLKITNEARLLALDMRLLDDNYDISDSSKIIDCVHNVYQIWNETQNQRSAQLIFSDIGTPKDNKFDAYNSIKDELVSFGIPESEIAFIHDAKNDKQRDQLFKKVRTGDIRVLIGSTGKLGTGVNVQNKLIAAHHIDTPWRPSDIEQRDGRIMRQGNENEEVAIYRYVTSDTFDAYLWQIQEQKQKYITQIMTSKSPSRSANDLDQTVLDAAEVKGLAMKNPLLKEKIAVDNEVYRLRLAKGQWLQEQRNMVDDQKFLKQNIPNEQAFIQKMSKDIETAKRFDSESFNLTIDNIGSFSENNQEARSAFIRALLVLSDFDTPVKIGTFNGFDILKKDAVSDPKLSNIIIKGENNYHFEADNTNALGSIQRLRNRISRLPEVLQEKEQNLEKNIKWLDEIEERMNQPFEDEEILQDQIILQGKINQAIEFGHESLEDLNENNNKSEQKKDERKTKEKVKSNRSL